MNYSELDLEFEKDLVRIQHICGFTLLVLNSYIIVIILMDGDMRNKHYRKYLCWVQLSSLTFDTFSDLYAPIVLSHRGVWYSDSLLSNVIGIWSFYIIEFVLLGEVLLSYFACVYYRRGIILGPSGRFNLIGWKRSALFLCLHAYALIAVIGMTYFSYKSVQAAEELLPSELNWVRSKITYMFITPDENWRNALIVVTPIADSIILAVIFMLVQLVREVKKVNNWASSATKKHQRLAVRSLILQGSVPSLLYLVPLYANSCLQFAPTLFDVGVDFNRFATVLSPILWIILTKHTIASSFVILYCSPSYRKRIASAVIPYQDLLSQLSETTRIGERTR